MPLAEAESFYDGKEHDISGQTVSQLCVSAAGSYCQSSNTGDATKVLGSDVIIGLNGGLGIIDGGGHVSLENSEVNIKSLDLSTTSTFGIDSSAGGSASLAIDSSTINMDASSSITLMTDADGFTASITRSLMNVGGIVGGNTDIIYVDRYSQTSSDKESSLTLNGVIINADWQYLPGYFGLGSNSSSIIYSSDSSLYIRGSEINVTTNTLPIPDYDLPSPTLKTTNGIYGRGGSVDIRDSKIDITGERVFGVYMTGEYTFDANNVFISVNGTASTGDINGWSAGIALSGSNHPISSDLNLNQVSILSQADYVAGLYAEYAPKVRVDNLNIETWGDYAPGIHYRIGSVYGLQNTTVTSTFSNTHIVTHGIDSYAFNSVDTAYEAHTQEGRINEFNFYNSSFRAENSSALRIANAAQRLLFDRSTVTGCIAGTDCETQGVAVFIGDVDDNNVYMLDASLTAKNQSLITGDVVMTEHPDGAKFDMYLNEGSQLTGAVSNLASDVTALSLNIDSSSLWNVRGDSNLNTLRNGGSVSFMSPSSAGTFKTVSVGAYEGGGLLSINTALGGDDSSTDKLVVTESASGATKVIVNNAGGQGAQTERGIEIVSVNPASDATFVLANRASAGAYDYTLDQNVPGSWRLNSGPSNVRPEGGAYLANRVNSAAMFMQRLYDRGQIKSDSNDVKESSAAWARIDGWHNDSSAADALDIRSNVIRVQVGVDLWRKSYDEGSTVAGLMTGYGRSDTHSDNGHTGYSAKSRVDGYSLGSYATWFGHDDKLTGPYADFWLLHGWYDNDINQGKESYNSRGWIYSAEGGYGFSFGQTGGRSLIVTPQLQLSYNSLRTDDHRDVNGTKVYGGTDDELFTRAGIRISAAEGTFRPFVEANWLNGDTANTVQYGDRVIRDDSPKNRYEFKLGWQGNLSDAWKTWGDVGGQWGKNGYRGVGGQVGLRYEW